MKILNLYCGEGGNCELWNDNNDIITAVEICPKIAAIYKSKYPSHTVIVADAHEYLLDHHKKFDFIWSSPPCQTHSRTNYFLNNGVAKRPRYPDMKLWQEIIFLRASSKALFCVENVVPYYKPILEPIRIGRHQLWANFNIPKIEMPKNEIGSMHGRWNVASKKPLAERNKANSEMALHILNCAKNIHTERRFKTGTLFS